MTLKLPTLLLSGSLLLLASAAQAQATFGMGLRLGLNAASVPFKDEQRTYSTSRRTGAEAGFVFDIGFGHFACNPRCCSPRRVLPSTTPTPAPTARKPPRPR